MEEQFNCFMSNKPENGVQQRERRSKLHKSFSYLESKLQNNYCFIGSTLSVADIAAFFFLEQRHMMLGLDRILEDYPQLTKFLARMQ